MTPPAPSTNGNGWFRVDNAVLDRIAIVGLTAAGVYVVLARYANNDSRTCYVGVETIAETLGITGRAVRNAIAKLVDAKMITVSSRRSDTGTSLSNLYRLLDLFPQEQAEPGFRGTLNVGSAKEDYREKDSSKKTTSRPRLRFAEADLETAKWMFSKIKALDGSQKEPSYPSWANTIRLLRERDSRTDQEIRDLFSWANADTFWRTNILSPSKLREKWGQLSLKAKVGTNGHGKRLLSVGDAQRDPSDRDRDGF